MRNKLQNAVAKIARIDEYLLHQKVGYYPDRMPKALKSLSAAQQKRLQDEITEVAAYLSSKTIFEKSQICAVCEGLGNIMDEDMQGRFRVQCSCKGKGYIDK